MVYGSRAADGGLEPWGLDLDEQMLLHRGQAPLDNMLLANLKHRLPSHLDAGQVPAEGSCLASLEQALYYPQAQLQASSRRLSRLPAELTDGPRSDFQGHLLNPRYAHYRDLVDNGRGTSHLQGSNLMRSASRGRPIVPNALPLLSGSLEAWKAPTGHWNTPMQRAKSEPEEFSYSGRRLLRVEHTKACATELSTEKLGLPEDFCRPRVENVENPTSDLLPQAAAAGCQQAEFSRGLVADSNLPSWSSEVSGNVSSDKDLEQEVETGNGFLCWKKVAMPDSSSRLEDWTGCNKRSRGMYEAMNNSPQAEVINVGEERSSIKDTFSDKDPRPETKKHQLLQAVVADSSEADTTSVSGQAAKQAENIENFAVSESATSSASVDTEDQNLLRRKSSPDASWMHGCMTGDFKQECNKPAAQVQFGGVSGMSLDSAEGLDGVVLNVMDGIPQIEVRMMENELVMIRLSSKDRAGLFTDIMFALQDLHLQVQHATIRTISGVVHDVFAAKVDVLLAEKQTTSDIAAALRQAMQNGNACNKYPTTANKYQASSAMAHCEFT